MRSKYSRRQPPPQQPRRRAGGRTAPIIVGFLLVVLGAALALTVERLVPGTSQVARATAAPSSFPSPVDSPSASAVAAASSAPTAPPSPAAPVLEAEMPRSVNGTILTVQSATNAASLGTDPASRALSAAMTSLGKKPADLEIAEAYDPAGALALTVLGFRLASVDPAKLRSVVLEAWLSTRTPGVSSSSVTLSGTPSTRVTYGDSGPSNYVFVHGDSVFVVVTNDQALAVSAVAAIAQLSPAGSPPAGSSPAPAGSPASSPSPSGG